MENEKLQLFEDQRIRTAWDEKEEEWYFSIVDVIAVLTESIDSVAYWRKLKQRLKAEGNETVTNCHALKMIAADGKKRLTDEITKAWSGMTTRQYKNLKGLEKESLRDNMSTLELALNMVAEAATTEISKQTKPEGLKENKKVANAGGSAARAAKESIESTTGKSVITSKTAVDLNHVVTAMIEDNAKLTDEAK